MTAHRAGQESRIRVLHSLAAPDGTTKFVDQMTAGAADDVDVLYFSWNRALRGRYDVLHLHWPEFLLRARTPRKRLMKRLAMRGTLAVTRLRRIPIVRTAHNTRPHDGSGRAEAALLRRVDRRTTLFIRLNPTTELDAGARAVTILHGHYRDRFGPAGSTATDPRVVLFFGIIRPRKNVETLIDVFVGRERPGWRLRIVGSPSAELGERIRTAVAGRDEVSAHLAFVEDDRLVAEIGAASLIVLPYAEMQNSGAALVALSLDRPVLVPRSTANEALAEEVGPGWVMQFDGPLTDDVLSGALRTVEDRPRTDRPRLEGRDWAEIGRRHRAAYLDAIALAHGRGNR